MKTVTEHQCERDQVRNGLPCVQLDVLGLGKTLKNKNVMYRVSNTELPPKKKPYPGN